MYGRESAGHRLTSATYQPAETIIATPPTSSLPTRFHSPTGAATRNASAKPGHHQERLQHLGQEREADRAARPTPSSGCCAVSMARTTQYAAATISSTSSASGLLNRNINAATGVSASAAPASRPGARAVDRVAQRRTAARPHRLPSAPAVAACVKALKPNIRPDSPINHSAAGGLSTVMAFPASSDPNSHAFRSCVPACAAARSSRWPSRTNPAPTGTARRWPPAGPSSAGVPSAVRRRPAAVRVSPTPERAGHSR